MIDNITQNQVVQMTDICKSFPGVKALDDARFDLNAGEVHVLLGENGAGKSTLVKMLSGVYTFDSGSMTLFGEHVFGDGNEKFSFKKAQELGIAMIHQELNMCQHLTVTENIFLGRELKSGIFLKKAEMKKQVKELFDSLSIKIDPDETVGNLSVSMQQMVEIAKALSMNAKILIMDEPTSALSTAEVEKLFEIIHTLKNRGVGIIYISHRLEELQYVCDRITIMRDGKYVDTKKWTDTSIPDIIQMMVGREITEKFPRVDAELGDVVFSVSNLNAGKLVRDVNFELREGEIVGIAGLMGAGRTETTRAIFGVDQKSSGEFVLKGKPIKINKPIDAIKQGVVLVPEDRKKDGLATRLSISDNVALPNLDIVGNKIGWLSNKKEQDMVDNAVNSLKIKIASPKDAVSGLSGGNQQKVVVGKWVARNFDVIMFDEPTRGVDVGAKVEIYKLMNHLKQRRKAVLFVSSELPEVLGMADRIIVMCDGKIKGEMSRAEATQEKIIALATQFDNKMGESTAV